MNFNWLFLFSGLLLVSCNQQLASERTKTLFSVSEVGEGYAATSVNATVFRHNSLVSHNGYQYIAYYDQEGRVVLGKRKLGSKQWEIHSTPFSGNIQDAHNMISIMVDGEGYLHVSWDHHNDVLHYARSILPETLELGPKQSMVGTLEDKVTYPEFYKLSKGDLLFLYRDGGSGNGNLVLNRYRTALKKWERIQDNLLDGENTRNAYWQAWVTPADEIHLSWVWREYSDAESNHDIGYAKSLDGGKTWQKSNGEIYPLPVSLSSQETVWEIPVKSSLINTTSTTADRAGNPYIAYYYKPKEDSCINNYLFYLQDGLWKRSKISRRTLDFYLGGGGTLRIPLSRPQLVCLDQKGQTKLFHIYRDEEFSNQIILSSTLVGDSLEWISFPINDTDVGSWEPSFDTELWKERQQLHLFVQKVNQLSGDNREVSSDPTAVQVWELNLK